MVFAHHLQEADYFPKTAFPREGEGSQAIQAIGHVPCGQQMEIGNKYLWGVEGSSYQYEEGTLPTVCESNTL